MAIKSEISWTRKTEDGQRIEVYARRFGGEWTFHWRYRRNEQWQEMKIAPLEDWLELFDAIRRRVPRKLYPPAELEKVRKIIRERFPEAPEID